MAVWQRHTAISCQIFEGMATQGSPIFFDLLPVLVNQVAHRLHIGGITSECQAAQSQAALDRSKQRVVVKGQIGGDR